MEWKCQLKNDWCEVLIFQSIAIETENGFRIKSVEEADIFLKRSKAL